MVYVTSDIHGAFDIHKINPREFADASKLTEKDFLVVCGDFGCVWDGGRMDTFWLNWLESLPWTTLFIDGNHENFDVISKYPVVDWNGGKVHQIRKNVLHLMRGEVFSFDSKKWLALGGGYSHDQDFREEGKNWWKEEIFNKEEADNAFKNLAKNDDQVDVVLSHDVFTSHPLADLYPTDYSLYPEPCIQHQDFLEEIRKKCDFKIWLCGHYHKDRLEFFDGKPCRMLFDDVKEIDDLIHEAQKAEEKWKIEHEKAEEQACRPIAEMIAENSSADFLKSPSADSESIRADFQPSSASETQNVNHTS